jgi:hypothetical protein
MQKQVDDPLLIWIDDTIRSAHPANKSSMIGETEIRFRKEEEKTQEH